MSTKMSVPTVERASELEQQARATADGTRALIATHGLETDPSQPNRLALQLADISDQLRSLLTAPQRPEPGTAASLCEQLVELTELQQDLREHVIGLRFRALSRIHSSLGRLRDVETVAELIAEAPEELCHCCDFDRAVISRVRGSTWVPEGICIAAGLDADVSAETRDYLLGAEIPLSPTLLETELARRGTPALITDPEGDPRTLKELMAVSQSKAYVVAPIMPTGHVIGFLHADCYGSERELTPLDRDNIWTFAEGFGLIFERMVLVERLAEQRTRVRAAFRSAESYIDELCNAEVKLARQERETTAVAKSAAGLFPAVTSRIDSLLTSREREVLSLMVSGARNSQIAGQLVISEGTVKSHVKNICRKLRASNRAEAVSKYLQIMMRERP